MRKFLGTLILLFTISLILWTQPHFKTRFCLTEGLLNDGDLIERLRPSLVRELLRHADASGFSIGDNRISETANLAIDLLTRCFQERGQNNCRYAGTNPNGDVRLWGRIKGFPDPVEGYEDQYRFVVPQAQVSSSIGVTIATMMDSWSWTAIEIKNYDLDWNWRAETCRPGCGCKSYVRGRGFRKLNRELLIN